jgi:hypothetical protein
MSLLELAGRSFTIVFCLFVVVNAVMVCKDLMAGSWDDED